MKRIDVRWVGDLDSIETCTNLVLRIIDDCTSEHRGVVTALVVLGRNESNSQQIPFVHKENLYLAYFQEKFVVIMDDSTLNIKELIFMYDNDIVNSSELHLNVDLVKLLSCKEVN